MILQVIIAFLETVKMMTISQLLIFDMESAIFSIALTVLFAKDKIYEMMAIMNTNGKSTISNSNIFTPNMPTSLIKNTNTALSL